MKDARSISELNIFRDGQRAGILRRTPAGCEFTFSEDFLQQQNFAGLCFCMQKSQTCLINPGVNLFPFFAGLLPEGLRLKSLLRNLKTSEDDLFSMFASIGDQVIGDVYAGINLGIKYFEECQWEDALRHFEEAVQINDTYPDAFYWVALAKIQLNKPTAARECLERAIELNPDYADAHFQLGLLLRAKAKKKARTSFEKALSLNLRPSFARIAEGILKEQK